MVLEFDVYEVKKDSQTYKDLNKVKEGLNDSEFIVVGGRTHSGEYYYKTLELVDSTVSLFADIPLDVMALLIKATDLKLKSDGIGRELVEMDIPEKNLNDNVISNIKRLNGEYSFEDAE